MLRQPSRPTIAAIGVAALLVTAGLVSVASVAGASTAVVSPPEAETTPTPPANNSTAPNSTAQLERRFESRIAALDSYTAVRTQTTEFGTHSFSTTSEVWYRLSTGEYRTETTTSGAGAGTVVVAGTETVWMYSNATGDVMSYNRTTNRTSSSVVRLADSYEMTDFAPATRDGEETYRVTLEPEMSRRSTDIDISVTAWLDRETYFPVAIERSTTFRNRTYTSTTTYENVTLNATIPDEKFTFEKPENATAENPGPDVETYDSLAAMRDSVNTTVPDPAVPGNFTFAEGKAISHNGTVLTLTYENESATLQVTTVDREISLDSVENAENVTIDGHDGKIRTTDGRTSLAWTCEGSTYVVRGPLDRDQLLDVARSITCE